MTFMTTSRLPGPPELDTLLDPASLRARLAAITDARGTLVGVRPFYLRWKPGTSALLGLELSWQTPDVVTTTFASLYMGEGLGEAADKAATLRLLEPPLGPALARLDDALYLAFPNDRELKGLSAVADARRVGNRLTSPGTPFRLRGFRKSRDSVVRPVRWKPGRRAVVELDLEFINDATSVHENWHAYARVMPADELELRLARWLAAAEVHAVAAPAVLFVDRERSWFATAAAPGRALASTPSPALLASLRAAFAELHAAPSPTLATRTSRDDLEAGCRALVALALVAPDLEPRAHALTTRLKAVLERLAPVTHVFTHGDLGADQLLVLGDAVAVIDWDEAANGDPHADWASLAADLRGRGLGTDWVEPLAREVLGASFDASRFAWQLAAAEARRVVEALQRGRSDWRPRALDALAAADCVLAMVAGASMQPSPDGSLVRTSLTVLADERSRFSVFGVDADAARIAAVWPEGDGGAIVRLEDASEPGKVVRWVRLGATAKVFDFPRDPALPLLADLLASGRFRIAGHRLGKRAALREIDGERFLFLRPEGQVAKAYARVQNAYEHLSLAGLVASRPLALADDGSGWWAEAVSGRTLDPARTDALTWELLGETLARAHATHGSERATSAGLDAAIQAGRKQIALVRMADPALADELDRDLAAAGVLGRAAPTASPAWIHGDLHPLQVLVGPQLVVLDWERARVGESEEDLGNFLAHLAWEAFDVAPAAWAALRRGYARAGGVWDAAHVVAHARAALARVRAIHGWRDGSRAFARDTPRWRAWQDGLAQW